MTPNIGRPLRTAYVVIGVLLLFVPLFSGLDMWIRLLAPLIGLSAIVAGGTGY
jgi:hypothetical protein